MTRFHHIGASRVTSTTARRWLPPAEPTGIRGLDWIAVERFMAGDLHPSALDRLEQREAAAALHHNGVSKKEIAKRLDVHEYTAYELLASAGVLPPELMCTVEGCWRARSGKGLCKPHLANEYAEVKRSAVLLKIRLLDERGLPADDIARAVDRSPKYVREQLTQMHMETAA